MPLITTTDGIELFFKDRGPKEATPLVCHRGWPLTADDRDAQMLVFLRQGFRVVAHDRRGHGRLSQSGTGNEMDTDADDVAQLIADLGRIDVPTLAMHGDDDQIVPIGNEGLLSAKLIRARP